MSGNSFDFSPPLLRLQESASHPLGRKVLWALLILLVFLLLWSLLGRLDIVAVAQGKLVPQSYVKIVQPSEAGIVKEILVREGESVAPGQVMMRMDALLSEADGKSLAAEHARKRLTLRRIDAELAGRPFLIGTGDTAVLAREIEAQLRANRAALEAALAEERSRLLKARQELSAAQQIRTKLTEVLPHYREQESAFDKLAKDGYAGPLMASDKRRERIEKEQELKTQEHVIESARAGMEQSQKRLAQIESDNRRQLYAERNEVDNALDKLTQEMAKQTHRQSLLELRSPEAAIVKDLATHTAGTVVQPGTVLLTLVPKSEVLRAEVWVANDDIGFLRAGQPVKLKFAAFPFQKYGMIDATVEHVSADAADAAANPNGPPMDASGRPAPLVYKALLALKKMNLELDGQRLPLTAGMQTSAEVLLGTRSVAEYLLSPVQKAWHEAGRER
jgi:hemolysin D